MANMAECESQSAGALVRVERDSVITKEPATDLQWIEILTSEVFVLPPTSGLLFDTRQEWLEPVRCFTRWLHRTATLAWPVSG